MPSDQTSSQCSPGPSGGVARVNTDWSLPAGAELAEGPGGLPVLRLTSTGGSGEVFLNGAHVASWAPSGHFPVLWMSDDSRYAEGEPIRGGIPICFPWFNRLPEHPYVPQHGFARIQPWRLVEVGEEDGRLHARFQLTDTELSRASVWPYRFQATYVVTMGEKLDLALEVQNRAEVEFEFEEALHTYFAVGDVHLARVRGLTQFDYYSDDLRGAREDSPVRIRDGVSRRYPAATSAIIDDPMNHRSIHVISQGAAGAVLWNPGPAEAAAIPDFADLGWRRMLCFETCNIGDGRVLLEPGATHRMRATVSVSAL
jgi:glucose-6-phosphate 1-epimerase